VPLACCVLANFSINADVVHAKEQTVFFRYFLDNIFGTVIAIIVVLGIMLIYSLLLNDVEAKTYEYGMLRALGMRNKVLIQVLFQTSHSALFHIHSNTHPVSSDSVNEVARIRRFGNRHWAFFRFSYQYSD